MSGGRRFRWVGILIVAAVVAGAIAVLLLVRSRRDDAISVVHAHAGECSWNPQGSTGGVEVLVSVDEPLGSVTVEGRTTDYTTTTVIGVGTLTRLEPGSTYRLRFTKPDQPRPALLTHCDARIVEAHS